MRRSSSVREKPMEDCMRECMRKLGLWYTRNFKPIMTHEELEPIMATLGFVALPSSDDDDWKEYVYCAGAGGWPPTEAPPPRTRLPYPRIDGLHIYTYTAFLEALDFYLHMNNISDLFHIRSVLPPFPSLFSNSSISLFLLRLLLDDESLVFPNRFVSFESIR